MEIRCPCCRGLQFKMSSPLVEEQQIETRCRKCKVIIRVTKDGAKDIGRKRIREGERDTTGASCFDGVRR